VSVAVYCSPALTVSALKLIVGVCVEVGNWYGTATDNPYPNATPITSAAKHIATIRVFAIVSTCNQTFRL